jgi:hypothetical protein
MVLGIDGTRSHLLCHSTRLGSCFLAVLFFVFLKSSKLKGTAREAYVLKALGQRRHITSSDVMCVRRGAE